MELAITSPRLALWQQTDMTVAFGCESGGLPNPSLVDTACSEKVDCLVAEDSYLHHECEFERFVNGLGPTAITVAAIALVQKLSGSRALKLLRRSSRVGPNWSFDELLIPQPASA